MTFPTINYKYNDIENGEALTKITDQKLEPMGKLLPESASVTCEVEFQKIGAHQQGKIHRVEANLRVDGTLHRAEAVEESFEMAIDEVRDELNKKLRRTKDRDNSMVRKIGQRVKEQFFRGG